MAERHRGLNHQRWRRKLKAQEDTLLDKTILNLPYKANVEADRKLIEEAIANGKKIKVLPPSRKLLFEKKDYRIGAPCTGKMYGFKK